MGCGVAVEVVVMLFAKCLIYPARLINAVVPAKMMFLSVYLSLRQPFTITEVDSFPP